MNDEIQQPDFADVLQPREKILWQSAGGPDKFDPWAWFFSVFWAIALVLTFAISFSILIERIASGQLAGNTPFVFVGVLILAFFLVLLARHIYTDLNREVAMHYAITNQRLIVQTASGMHRNSLTGRPFVSLTIQGSGENHDINLMGVGDEQDAVLIQLVGVSDAQLAEKILLANFMQKPGAKA